MIKIRKLMISNLCLDMTSVAQKVIRSFQMNEKGFMSVRIVCSEQEKPLLTKETIKIVRSYELRHKDTLKYLEDTSDIDFNVLRK